MELRQAAHAAGIGVVAASEHLGPSRLHRALPALRGRLVVSLGAPMEVRYDGQVRHLQAVVAGLMRPGAATPELVLRSHQPTVYVDLAPSALHRLTSVPPRELDAGGVDADVLLPWAHRLGEELAARPADRREALVREHLLRCLDRADRLEVRRDAHAALRIIGACEGRISVEELARQVHLGPRRLRQVMHDALGIGPKFASRVARLAAALDRARAGADSWARVAAESGHHDQSHLVRDFKDLMRTTPTGWLAEEGRNLQGRRLPAT
ncbi:helix-turn-helix domain-containing protein [Streptomyces sp. NPDC006992]|uniref:helix-turn-helix domain-containing protein n=1 Tax=unclassified Streptomyces TaxID=2593676 RepID=UPI0033CC5028